MKFLVVKIAPKQSEFPELIGDVFANVGNRTVGAHDYFGIVIFYGRPARCVTGCIGPILIARFGGVRAFIHAHHPASGIFSCFCKMDRVALFQQLKCGIPEFQVQNLALAWEEIVLNAQSFHCVQMTAHDGGSHDAGHLRSLARSFFDRFQHFAAQGKARFVFLKKMRNARI